MIQSTSVIACVVFSAKTVALLLRCICFFSSFSVSVWGVKYRLFWSIAVAVAIVVTLNSMVVTVAAAV